MSFDIGINFRATSGYVTDGANETYCLGDVYPTTRGGVTFGWDASLSGGTRDRNSGLDRRLAGINYIAAASGQFFRIDLPSSGSADVHIAAGDAGAGTVKAWDLQDNTTTFKTLTDAYLTADFADATDTTRTAAAWPRRSTRCVSCGHRT